MARDWRQFLVLEAKPAAEHGPTSRAAKHPGLTWHDHLVMLLHVAAEIEHGLMVQYLYAAYSLGGPDAATPKHQACVRRWQTSLLRVAKEEMGHLLTVQNILRLVGAPVNFGREDYPWSVPYYPFQFRLEKLTRSSLACYVHAEMPPHLTATLKKYPHLSKRFEHFVEEDKAEIARLIKERAQGPVHTVAAIYDDIIAILGNEKLIPDSAFNEESYASQAAWDDWGRSYGPEPKALDPSGSTTGDPSRQHEANVIIMRAATRTQALAALKAISGQGEAVHFGADHKDESSHFERFLHIFQEFPKSGEWVPTHKTPTNPTTRKSDKGGTTYIAGKQARAWAVLSNYRYRMLLTSLAHSFRLSREVRAGEPNLRGVVMHRVFGEMYNLKTIAGILVGLESGSPFEMPYSLTLPDDGVEIWRLHRELLVGSLEVAETLASLVSGEGRDYLKALDELDRRALAWIDSVIGSPSIAARGRV